MPGRLTCSMCGICFQGRADAIYCSAACRQKSHRARTARRTVELAARRTPIQTRRVLIKPDVASTIQRARLEERRARELCRTAAETLRQSVVSQQQLMAVRWLTRVNAGLISEERG